MMNATTAAGLAWLQRHGVVASAPDFSLDALETLAAAGVPQATFVNANWTLFRELIEAQRPRPLFARLGRLSEAGATAAGPSETDLIRKLKDAPAGERPALVKAAIREDLSRVLGLPAQNLRDDTGFFNLGMDSLMAVEFRDALSKRLGRKLSVTVVMVQSDIDTLTAYVMENVLQMAAQRRPAERTRQTSAAPDRVDAEVEGLSAGQVASALDNEINEVLGER